jgi:hypothetical protein
MMHSAPTRTYAAPDLIRGPKTLAAEVPDLIRDCDPLLERTTP